jgi:hypothetical protein
MLLTSRERPPEVTELEGIAHPVHLLELDGLHYLDCKKIFEGIDSFSGSEKEGKPMFAGMRELLDWHFERLSDSQREVMYWFAINRETISLAELEEDILSTEAKEQLPSTLQQLQYLLPLEKNPQGFTLQPVFIEYMAERLIERVVKEIKDGRIALFDSHALLKASAIDYVRESQVRMILQPVIKRVGKVNCEKMLKRLLSLLHVNSILIAATSHTCLSERGRNRSLAALPDLYP